MFERFTDQARRVLVLAQEESALLRHSFIGTEHVLLGLIHEGDGVAARALEDLGVTLQAVRQKVEETIGMSGLSSSFQAPFTPRTKKVLELALRESLQMSHSYIGTEHLLLGLVREGEGVACTVLVSLGADLGRVRQTVLQLMAGQPEEDLRAAVVGPVTSVFEVGDDLGLAQRNPKCPHCRAAVAKDARYRIVNVAPDPEGEDADALPLVVVFCVRCGSNLAVLPPPPVV